MPLLSTLHDADWLLMTLNHINCNSLDCLYCVIYFKFQGNLRWDILLVHLSFFLDRERILSLLENNRVVVLCGETGCGKTTQVPQFILDSYLEKREGAKCNIVVTQVCNTDNTIRIFYFLQVLIWNKYFILWVNRKHHVRFLLSVKITYRKFVWLRTCM